MDRRKFIQGSVLATAGVTTLSALSCETNSDASNTSTQLKGNINHSMCRWTFGDMELADLLSTLKSIGVNAIDLIGPDEWPLLKEMGIDCSMCNGAEINLVDGWNQFSLHEQLIKQYSDMIPKVAEAGYKNLICFSGNRYSMDDEQGLRNCVTGLRQILPLAEQHGVVIQMELFNSKIDHPDYMCDNTPWGMQLVDALGSDNFTLLYDIYHMQIQEGDIIRTIKNHSEYFGHYHTAGVPGRNEIEENQELNYPAIMDAILETGYTGYVAQEFIPTREDKLESLKKAIAICDR